jgi:hypothetical protein
VATALAGALNLLGEAQAARELAADTLARCRRVLGDDNPVTLYSAAVLAIALAVLGEAQAAQELAADTLAKLLEQHLRARGVGSLFLHGGVPVRRREAMVAEFQEGKVPVFLLSLKAGGSGLTLTRATHVLHYDRWWNPAVEDQASDRAYRIGQDRPVQVHRLVTEGTVEDRVAALLETKRELADAVVGSGEGWVAQLSDAELADLVALREVA